MPTSFYVLLGIAVLLWLAGLIACVMAIRWTIAPTPVRRWTALGLALLALAVGHFAPQYFQFSYSKTTNGEIWSIQSRWFFVALYVFSVISVCVALLGFTRRQPRPEPDAPPNGGPATRSGDSGVTEGPPSVS